MEADVRMRLEGAGYDVSGALARFVNNEDLYVMFMKKFVGDENYAKIRPYVEAMDYDNAYKSAHALKGVAGNLGITDVFEVSVALLDVLRGKTEADPIKDEALALCDKLTVSYEKACNLIGLL